MSATITCNDWTDSHNNVHKGCGATLRWPTDEEKRISGSKKPVNPDGSPHIHNDKAPKSPPKTATSPPAASQSPSGATATKAPAKPFDRPYYEGVEEVALETDVKSVNNYLRSGWVILRIAERQGYSSIGSPTAPQLMASSEIVFVLGRRAA